MDSYQSFCFAFALFATACGSTSGRHVTPSELATIESRFEMPDVAGIETTVTGSEGSSVEGVISEGGRRRQAEREEALQQRSLAIKSDRKAAEHQIAVLSKRQEREAIEGVVDAAAEEQSVLDAQWELGWVRDELTHFIDVEWDRRMRSSALELQDAADELRDAREELEDYESKVGEDIAPEYARARDRLRRRVDWLERNHALRQEEHGDLHAVFLPREQGQLEAAVASLSVSLQNAQKLQAAGYLAREESRLSLEHELWMAEQALKDVALAEVQLSADLGE